MKYLKIANTGIVDHNAFALIGASTKRGDENKIGMFGSGNKFALAYLFRHGIDFKVFSGMNEIVFSTIQQSFGEMDFKVITINGDKTSITTEMGHKWKLWQTIREFYSNALDEGLTAFEMVDEVSPNCDETHIYLQATQHVQEFFFNKLDYFAEGKEILFENEEGKIYRKHGVKTCIYRKGIACDNNETASIFDYDFPKIEINESRLVEYPYVSELKMWETLLKCNNQMVIRSILNAPDNVVESRSNSYISKCFDVNDAWLEALGENKISPTVASGWLTEEERLHVKLIPTHLYNILVNAFGDEIKASSLKRSSDKGNFKFIDNTDPLHKVMLDDVLTFFKECNFQIPYDIKFADFRRSSVMGCAHENEILLSPLCFEQGKEYVANTIIEEYIHLKHGVSDETRGFQNASIGELIGYMKRQNSYNL